LTLRSYSLLCRVPASQKLFEPREVPPCRRPRTSFITPSPLSHVLHGTLYFPASGYRVPVSIHSSGQTRTLDLQGICRHAPEVSVFSSKKNVRLFSGRGPLPDSSFEPTRGVKHPATIPRRSGIFPFLSLLFPFASFSPRIHPFNIRPQPSPALREPRLR